MSHVCLTCVSRVSHLSLNCLSLFSHLSLTFLSPVSCLSFTYLSHVCVTCVSPVSHLSLTCLSLGSHVPVTYYALTCVYHSLTCVVSLTLLLPSPAAVCHIYIYIYIYVSYHSLAYVVQSTCLTHFPCCWPTPKSSPASHLAFTSLLLASYLPLTCLCHVSDMPYSHPLCGGQHPIFPPASHLAFTRPSLASHSCGVTDMPTGIPCVVGNTQFSRVFDLGTHLALICLLHL